MTSTPDRPSHKAALAGRVRFGRTEIRGTLVLCADPERNPGQIVGWFVRRWSVEVTFQEIRAQLGVETKAAAV